MISDTLFLKKVRLWIAKFLWRFFLGPTAGKIPNNCIYSIEEASEFPKVSNHLETVYQIYASEIISWNFPESYPKWIRRNYAFQPRSIFLLKSLLIGPISGAVWSKDGSIFMESIGSLNKALTFGNALPEIQYYSGRTVSVDSSSPIIPCPRANYFHWMLEVLPALIRVASHFADFRILLHPEHPKYIEQALRLWLGTNKYSTTIIKSSKPILSGLVAFQSMPLASGFVHPQDAVLVRETFLNLLPIKKTSLPHRKIFVSRKGNVYRKVSNEDQLEQRFYDMGYEILHLENLDWSSQIETFLVASHVAGLHGAGFSNIIFAPFDCKVHEVFPPNYRNDCYARLATGLGMKYSFELCA